MDALLAEIAAKKSALNAEAGPSSDSGAKKYMRRAEVEAAQEEAERRKKEEARERLRLEKEERLAKRNKKDAEGAKNGSLARLAQVDSLGNTPEPEGTGKEHALSSSELIRRLRARAQPIRLFGETDKDRRARLRALELGADERGQGGKADEFWRTLKGVEKGLLEKDAEVSSKKRKAVDQGEKVGGKKEEKSREIGEIDLPALKEDLNKAYPIVYWAFKNLYKEWEEWMEARPDDIKRSTQGKLALATHVQSGVNMKPLFKQLRSRDMPPDLIYKLAELVHFAQIRQYQRANDAYLRLSIGNAAWPIGVTSVGLHERGAREKITEDVVAHVLNDEVSRKWIQAVKRLLTFSQMVRPPADASQAMG